MGRATWNFYQNVFKEWFISYLWNKSGVLFLRGSCLVFMILPFESHNYSRHQVLIRGLGTESLVIKWTVCGVWFLFFFFLQSLTGESSESLLSSQRLFTCRRWPLRRYKGGAEGEWGKKRKKNGKRERQHDEEYKKGGGRGDWRRKKGGEEGGKVLLGEQRQQQPCSVLQVFSSPSLRLPPPPSSWWPWLRGMCSLFCVRRERRGGGRGTPLAVSPTFQSHLHVLVPPHCLCVRPRRRPGVEEWRVFKRLQESYEDQQRCHVFGCLQKLPCNNITLPPIKSDVRNNFFCVDKSVYEACYKVELGEPGLNLKTIRNDFHLLKLFGYNRPL